MKSCGLEVHLGEFISGYLCTRGVGTAVERGSHPKPFLGGSSRYEANDHLVAHERLSAPIHADEGE